MRVRSESRASRRRLGAMCGSVLVGLVTVACGSILHHDSTSPVGLVATGTPWAGVFHSDDLPAGTGSATSISCPTPDTCWATVSTVGIGAGVNGATVIRTRNGGATWTLEAIPPTVSYLSGVSCRDVSHCVAVGQTAADGGAQGVVLSTEDGGRAWNVAPGLGTTADVTAVTCLSNGHCLAVASGASGALAITSDSSGGRWQAAGALPPGTVGATSISCADGAHCWVTGQVMLDVDHTAGSVDYTTDFGTSWAAASLPAGTGVLGGIACTTANGTSASLPYGSSPTSSPGGAGASSSTTPTAPSAATSTVPAPTTTTVPGVPGYSCTAVGSTATAVGAARTGRGVVLTTGNGGSTWVAEHVPAPVGALAGISCPALGSCAAVGTTVAASSASGVVVLTGVGNDTWRHAATLTVPQPLAAASCPSVGHCVLGGVAVTDRLAASS